MFGRELTASRFDNVRAVRQISLDIPDKEFVVLVGPSVAATARRYAWSPGSKRRRRWQCILDITLPMMRNIIAFTVLFSLIVTFANLNIVQIMTNGGLRNVSRAVVTDGGRIEQIRTSLGTCGPCGAAEVGKERAP